MQESIDFCTFLHNSQFQRLNDFDVLVTAGENVSKRSYDEIQVAGLLNNPGVNAQKNNKHRGAGKKSNLANTLKKSGVKQNKKQQGEAGVCQVRV